MTLYVLTVLPDAPNLLVNVAGEPDEKIPEHISSVRRMLKVAVDQLCDDAMLSADARNKDPAMDILGGMVNAARLLVARTCC